jgi:hypothetical protein
MPGVFLVLTTAGHGISCPRGRNRASRSLVLARNPAPKKRRSSAKPRWGWSGGALIQPLLDRKDMVRSIVERMPVRASKIDHLTQELLQLAGRYHRYLHQDEFGPTRAERLATLREVIEQIDALFAEIARLPRSLRWKISNHLAKDEAVIASSAARRFWNDMAAARRIALAAKGVGIDITVKKRPAQAELIERLTHEANKTAGLLASLDTTTEGDVFLLGSSLVGKRLRKTESLDPLMSARISLTRLRQRAIATLEYLEKRKGAEPAISLPLLVSELCELWRRETGSPVTGDTVGYRRNRMSKAGNFHKGRITVAGQFVLDLVKVFRPMGSALGARLDSVRARNLLIESDEGRVRIIHRAILKRISGRPRETKRGRPRVQ